MWHLIAAQFRYYRLWLVPSLAIILSFGIAASALASHELAVKVWSMPVPIVGVGIVGFLWFFDMKERRQMLWSPLPVPRHQVFLARMLLAVGLVSFLSVAGAVAVVLQAETAVAALSGLATLVSGHAAALFLTLMTYFYEELNAALLGRPTVWWLVQLGTLVALVAAIVTVETYPPAGLGGILFGYLGAAVFGWAALYLFTRRDSLMVGTDPVRGVPLDWSR